MTKPVRRIAASAGSGKTYALTERFLHLLDGHARSEKKDNLDTRLLREILAITFTNAAAAEMRSRVISRLKETILEKNKEESQFPANADAYLDRILHDYSSLNIRTIDSLLHMLVRGSAFDLGLNPEFEIVFDEEDVFGTYQEKLFEDAESDPDLLELLENAFRAGVDSETFKGFRADDKFEEKLYEILIRCLTGNEFDELHSCQELAALEKAASARLAASATGLLKEFDNAGFRNINKKSVLPMLRKHAKGQSKISDFAKKTSSSDFTQKSSPKELCTKEDSKLPVPESLQNAFMEWRQSVDAYREIGGGLYKKAALMGAFIEVAKKIGELYREQAGIEKKLPFPLVPHLARKVLPDQDAVSNAALRIGTRLSHFLVDEFQDTSREQWQILRPLVHEALSKGGTMTFVGDVKQSIYGFRGGDPELFDNVLEDAELKVFIHGDPKEMLTINRRSLEGIVAHNNGLFAKLGDVRSAKTILSAILGKDYSPEIIEAGARRIAEIYADAHQEVWEKKKGPAIVAMVEIETENSEQLKQEINRELVSLLKDKLHPRRQWKEILVLCRGNEQSNEYARELVRNNIPVITENSLLLSEHSLIAQTLAFLRFLANRDDEIAFWALLQGSIISQHPQWTIKGPGQLSDWAAMASPTLQKAFTRDYPDLWKRFFRPFFTATLLVSAYDAVREWYGYLEVEKRFPKDVTFINRFLELLYALEQDGVASISAFLQKWEGYENDEKVPMPDDANAVTIMTFHKAKGLQKEVVILPKTGFSVLSSNPVIIKNVGGRIIPVKVTKENAQAEYQEDMLKQVIESFNILYVGLTRASEELYYFLEKSSSDKMVKLSKAYGELFAGTNAQSIPDLPDSEENNTGDQGEEGLAGQADKNIRLVEEWRPMKWQPRLNIYRAHASAMAMTAAERGTFVHACLERLKITAGPQAAVNAAFAQTLRQTHYNVPENEARDIKDKLLWFATLPDAAKWLAKGWKEQSIMKSDGEVARADLIVSSGKDVLIIDYKTGQPSDEHIEQIRGYLQCLSREGHFTGSLEGLLIYIDLKKFRTVTLTEASPLRDKAN